ncbi:unnamed protein product [Scytosiphon promiscuus]
MTGRASLRRPAPIDVGAGGRGGGQQAGKWRQLSPRTADHLLGQRGVAAGDTGIFGETIPFSPGSSTRPSSGREGQRRDSRRTILLSLTYFNLFLALVLITVGGAGPQYPGHSGTTDNPVSNWSRRLTTQVSPLYQTNCPTEEVDGANASVLRSALIVGLVIWFTQPCSARFISRQVDQGGATAMLLTSVVSSLTCLASFVVVMLDISYIAGCCSLLQDNCEVSNLCTQFVDDCCISDAVQDYCGTPSYHIGAVSMIFLAFVSTSCMVIMASTIACRCWLDADPERQAMLMVLTGSPYGSPRGNGVAGSPRFSPRNTLLSGLLGDGNINNRATSGTPTKRTSRDRFAATPTGWEEKTDAEPPAVATREQCPHCGAVFGDVHTLLSHVERFHAKGKTTTGTAPPSRTEVSSSSTAVQALGAGGVVAGGHRGGSVEDYKRARPKRSLTRKGSAYEPDEGPIVLARPPGVGVGPGRVPSP